MAFWGDFLGWQGGGVSFACPGWWAFLGCRNFRIVQNVYFVVFSKFIFNNIDKNREANYNEFVILCGSSSSGVPAGTHGRGRRWEAMSMKRQPRRSGHSVSKWATSWLLALVMILGLLPAVTPHARAANGSVSATGGNGGNGGKGAPCHRRVSHETNTQ